MKPLHWKQEIKYLNAVAKYLIELGFHVEEPDPNHRDLLDVWGTVSGRRCFVEIYVSIYRCDHGINGIWHQGDSEGEELFLSDDPTYGLDTRFAPMLILEDLKPFKRGKFK